MELILHPHQESDKIKPWVYAHGFIFAMKLNVLPLDRMGYHLRSIIQSHP